MNGGSFYDADDLAAHAADYEQPRQYGCSDRLCGALDCVTCHPSSADSEDSSETEPD